MEDILEVSKEIGKALSEIPNAEMKWDEFTIKLMGDDSRNSGDISQITKSNSDFGDRCKALLNLFKQTTSEEPQWDRVEEVLREIKLNEPARKLHNSITSLNSRQLPLRAVGHTHQSIPQASNGQYLEGKQGYI